MLKTSSFKKGMAVLVGIAVIILFFPKATYSSTDSSNPKSPLLKKFITSFISIFPFFNPHFTVLGVSKDKPNSQDTDKDKKDPYGDHGNSTSKRRPNDKE